MRGPLVPSLWCLDDLFGSCDIVTGASARTYSGGVITGEKCGDDREALDDASFRAGLRAVVWCVETVLFATCIGM